MLDEGWSQVCHINRRKNTDGRCSKTGRQMYMELGISSFTFCMLHQTSADYLLGSDICSSVEFMEMNIRMVNVTVPPDKCWFCTFAPPPHTHTHTKFMEHSPFWEANSSSASHDLSRILWNPKVHYLMSQSWARSIQSMPPHHTPWRSIFILFYHVRVGLPSGVSLRSLHQNDYTHIHARMHACIHVSCLEIHSTSLTRAS